MEITIYHNPRCAKSRAALALLRSHGVEPRVVEYLKTPPSARELARILKLLGIEARALLRTKEPIYRQAGLARADLKPAALIDAMVRHPVLIERPLIVAGERAVVARPPEKALTLLPPARTASGA